MSESEVIKKPFLHIPFDDSESFHLTYEGKVCTRLLINLCWWLHDMYEIDSTDLDTKLQYIEQQINHCQALFPAKFTLMFSDPEFSPNDQHPLLICRQEEQKVIILVFRATVSSKSIADVFTDASIYSNHQVYLGDRHAGFTQRMQTAPLLAVTNWLRQGWRVIITGHSLGGAISQLFTAAIASKLVEAGLSPNMVSLRCITFGTPQCADYHFWSSYTDWYDVFDTYIYGHDAIFRLTTFGATVVKEITDSFAEYLQKLGVNLVANIIGYRNKDQSNILIRATDPIRDISRDILIPVYSIFGRHHFIRKNEIGQFKIDSIGQLEEEKLRLLKDLTAGHCWYDYFIEKNLIPEQFKFIYREFMEHGCYPFCINQLFNQNINLSLGKKNSIKQKIFRLDPSNIRVLNSKVSNITAIINFPDEINLLYIYFQGFLADFITSVKLPIQLTEGEQLKEKKPILSQDQSDECAVLCTKSNASIEFLRAHSGFEVSVKTYFGCFNVQVAVLTNFNSIKPSIYHLDLIAIISRAYCEFVLDANCTEQIDSPLSHCFSSFFAAFKHIGRNEFDTIMARFWAEAHVRNLYSNVIERIQKCSMPETQDDIKIYFEKHLMSLKMIVDDDHTDHEMKRNALFLHRALAREIDMNGITLSCIQKEPLVEEPKLIDLYLDFSQLRKYLHSLHIDFKVAAVHENLKMILAPFFLILMKLNRLNSVEFYTFVDKVVVSIQRTSSNYRQAMYRCLTASTGILAAQPMNLNSLALVGLTTLSLCAGAVMSNYYSLGNYKNVLRSLRHIAISLLISTNESVNGNENEWDILSRVARCHWSRELAETRSPDERDAIWNRIFSKKPLQDISLEHRSTFVAVTVFCRQLCMMRQILAREPPKVLIVGQSQTGKSTLFEYLTERKLEELHNISNFNTRMSRQCLALIKLGKTSDDDTNTDNSVLPINIIDSPGFDDATGVSDVLLHMSLEAANLIILMTTLKDINQMGTIKLLDKILDSTRVKVLILINQVDLRLKDAWEQFRKKNSDKYNNSDEDDSDQDELDEKVTRCKILDTLLERPQKELIQGLTVDENVINNRITFQPIILKGFNEFTKTLNEPNFRHKVHKSNVNKWIKQNLINLGN